MKIVVVILLTCLFAGVALAADYYQNLNYSRDILLKQRDYLIETRSKINEQINILSNKLDKVNQYLDDNNRSLNEIEYALKNAR